MTATLAGFTGTTSPPALPMWSVGAPRLLAGPAGAQPLRLAAHLSTHGTMPDTELPRLLAQLQAVGLTGRGGAGFPLHAKISSLVRGDRPPRSRRLVVNGCESDPASRKDRALMSRSPHLVLDGALTVAHCVCAAEVTVVVHDPAAAAAVRAAITERPDATRVRVLSTSPALVAGESRAAARAAAGDPALPDGRRRPTTEDGTLVCNVETLAQVAVLVRLGARGFAEAGTGGEPGTTLITLAGGLARPAVVEIPLGTPLGILLEAAGTPRPQALVLGGYHGTWLPPLSDVLVSRSGLAVVGAQLGPGAILALSARTCAVGELARIADWLAASSAGQCGPCRFGLPALAADVAALAAGDPRAGGRLVARSSVVAGRGACAHPDGAGRFLASGLRALADELDLHRRGGCGRPVLGELPLAVA